MNSSHKSDKFDLSIIIPSYNEQNYLPDLLTDLCNQQFKHQFEVIVVDTSTDSTKLEALKFSDRLNINIVDYKLSKGVSAQRNYGAKVSRSPHLLFIDADTRLPSDSLSRLWEKAIEEGYSLATSSLKANSNMVIDHISLFIYNLYAIIRNPISPIAVGAYMYTRKDVFEQARGFNPKIVFAEDFDLAQRIKRNGYPLKYVLQPLFLFSVRRLDDMGRFNFFLRTVYNGLVLLLPQKWSDSVVYKYKLEGHTVKKRER